MTRKILFLLLAASMIIPLTWFAIGNPVLVVVGVVAMFMIIALAKVSGWWRRVYTVTILSMFAGASHFEALVVIGGVGKMLSLALLTLVTFATTRGLNTRYSSGTHKLAIFSLGGTAGLALLSTLWSVNRIETITQALAFVAFVYIVHKVSTTRWTDKETLTGDIKVAYWVSFTALSLGMLLALAGVSGVVSDYSGRYLGVLGNPNRLGIVAAVTLAIGVGVALHRRHPLIWMSLMIPASQVLLSQSRTAIVAVTIGLLWVIIRGGLVRIIAVGFVIIIAVLNSQAFNINPFGDTLSRFGEHEGGDILNARTHAWGDVVSLLQQNSLGTGWATTTNALTDMNQAGITSGLNSVHNSYLQLLFELGWLGVIPVVLTFCLFIVVTVRGTMHQLGAGLTIATVTGSIIHFTESAMFGIGQPYPYLFWFAVMAAVVTIGSKPENIMDTKPDKRNSRSGRALLVFR